MSSVDSRIVTMKFDNKQFQDGASSTLSMLDKLKQSLSFSGASKGLDELSQATGKVNLNSLEGGITRVSAGFAAMATVAITALSTITSKAITAGSNLVKSLTVDPIKSGLSEYETNLNSIQTILANTQSKGSNLKDVNKALQELNDYSDQTIYNFSEMARNIGTFTAAGVGLKPATEAIKGISNLAAVSGSSAEQASTAMYQLSQAMASGAVKLQDWNSVVNAGMGGEVFQTALKRTAKNFGTDVDAMIAKSGSFRETLRNGWLTTEVLTQTLSQFTGDLTDAQLKSMGYSKAQIKEIQALAKTAIGAATEVKTVSQLLGTLQETAGSGWAQTWQIIFGDFEEAKQLFTGVNEVFGSMISASSNARNKVLGDWKALDGRKNLIAGIKNVFEALVSVIKPIKEAFREIFPAITGKQLADLTKQFKNFTKGLKIGGETADSLKSTFKGVFAIFSIAKQILSGIVGVIFDVVGALGSGSGGLLKFTGGIGEFIAGIDAALKKGDLLKNFFDTISGAITPVVKLIVGLAGSLLALSTGQATPFLDNLAARFETLGPIINTIKTNVEDFVNFVKTKLSNIGDLFNFGSGAGDAGSGVKKSLGELPSVMDRVRQAWDRVVEGFESAKTSIAPIIDNLKSGFEVISQKIKDFVKGMGIEEALAVVNTGFFIALYIALKSFVSKMGGLVDSLGGIFEQVTSNLKTMQTDVRADIILKIGASLLLLAIALKILASIDIASLAKSLYATAILLGMLIGALTILEDSSSVKGSLKLALLSVGLVALSASLVLMAGALKILGSMDPNELNQGILALAKVLTIIIAATAVLGKTGGGGQLIATAAGIAVLAAALVVFAGAIKLYSEIDPNTLLSGGYKIAGSLLVIAATMRLMPKNMLASASALLIVSAALVVMSIALKMMATITGGDTVQVLVLLGGALFILSKAVTSMTTAIPGAQAMLMVSAALLILGVALRYIGETPWQVLALAIGTIVVALLLLGGVAFIIAPVVPVIYALGAAIAMLGLATLAVGAGLFLFAAGLAALAASGAAGMAVLTGVIVSIAQLFPLIMHQIGLGIIAFAKVIGDAAPVLVEAIGKLIKALILKLHELIPLLPPIIRKGLRAFLQVITDYIPEFISAGISLVAKLIAGVAKRVPELTRAGTDLLISFMNAIAKEIPRLADSGAKAVIKFVNGVADAIDKNSDALGRAGGRLGAAIITGMAKGIWGAVSEVVNAAREVAGRAMDAIAGIFKINSPSKAMIEVGKSVDQGLALGLLAYVKPVEDAGETVANAALDTMKTTMTRLSDVMDADLNLYPVVTPILDLSQLQSNASKITSLLSSAPISAEVSYAQASTISNDKTTSQGYNASNGDQTSPVGIKFEQNNYSPKALTPIEIYRNTRNQLSMAKEELVYNGSSRN